MSLLSAVTPGEWLISALVYLLGVMQGLRDLKSDLEKRKSDSTGSFLEMLSIGLWPLSALIAIALGIYMSISESRS